ncbi:MAG: hypothetical protein ABI064_07480 [Acidobacteriaceae bacterium]
MRDLVAGYESFGDQRYLETAIAYGDYLLQKQLPNGFWATGYGPVYLADTGSALGLFIALYNHVDRHRQKEYFDAIRRYVNSLEKNKIIQKNGAMGDGWDHPTATSMGTPSEKEYTLAEALTGGEIFTWMYHKTRQDRYREIAYRSLKRIFSTMRADGNIPYISADEGADWVNRGDPKTSYNLWTKMTYGTAGYVGEGVASFDLYCGNPVWRAWIRKAVKPNIEFLLRTQLTDGTWSKLGPRSWDRTRSPGIVNYLIWYYQHVDQDPRVARAVRRFDAFIIKPENGKSYGLLNEGANPGPKDKESALNTATALTGRAIAGILSPGVTVQW